MASRSTRLALLAPTLLAASTAFADVYGFRVVAETGKPAPGTLGGTYTSFGGVAINASGQVAFQADTTGPIADSGEWFTLYNNPQVLGLIIGEDYPVPGAPGVHFGEFVSYLYGPILNDNGDVGFSGPLALPGTPTGIFRMINGAVQKVALPGEVAPGSGGLTFDWISNLIAFNDDGLVALRGKLAGRTVNAGNDFALFLTWFGGLTMVAREGNGAPGLAGTTFGVMDECQVLLGNDGSVGFDTPLNGAQGGMSSRWRGWPGLLQCLVKSGDPSPIGGTFAGVPGIFWTQGLSTDGAAFGMSVDSGGSLVYGLWHATPGGVVPLAVKGQLGPLGFYDSIESPIAAVASDGTTAFHARFSWFGLPDEKDSAVVVTTPGEAGVAVMKEGNAAYGFGAGVEIDDLMSPSFPAAVASTDSGWILIMAKVRGPGINNSNNIGCWAVDPDGATHFIARHGEFVSFHGEPARQISTLAPAFRSGPNSGRRSSINERGDVALRIEFTNGDQAVVVAQLPGQCPADRNGDGTVDAVDLGILLGGWGTPGPVGTGGDVDRDGDTDGADLAILLGAWGPCGS